MLLKYRKKKTQTQLIFLQINYEVLHTKTKLLKISRDFDFIKAIVSSIFYACALFIFLFFIYLFIHLFILHVYSYH